jgi:hypothetical protein
VQFRNLGLSESDHANTGKAQALVEAGDVFLIAAQAIQGFGQDNIEAAAEGVINEGLDARAQDEARPADRLVGILFDDRPSLLLGMGSADAELICNRRLALAIRGIASVNRDLHYAASSAFGWRVAALVLAPASLHLLSIPTSRRPSGQNAHQFDQAWIRSVVRSRRKGQHPFTHSGGTFFALSSGVRHDISRTPSRMAARAFRLTGPAREHARLSGTGLRRRGAKRGGKVAKLIEKCRLTGA